MDLPPADDPGFRDAVPRLTFFLSVLAIASLGSIARLLNDYKDEPDITRRIWAAYLTSGLLAGVVLALILINIYGPSYLLIGLAGLAGFQSVQTLTWLGLGLKALAERLFGKRDE